MDGMTPGSVKCFEQRKRINMQNKRTIQKRFFQSIAILVALFVFTGCTLPALPTATAPSGTLPDAETPTATSPAAGTPEAGAPTSLENTRWELVSWGVPGAETAVIAGSTVTLEFSDTGEVGGSGGCNTYGGAYTVQDNLFVFSEIVSTLMACADQAVTEQEMEYLAALPSAGRFEINDGTLTIWVDGERGVLNFVAAAPTAPIDETSIITPGATLTATETLTSTASGQSGQ
jgi:heat shock protein HslJ